MCIRDRDNAIDIPRAQPLRFYESYESFKANNPLPNYEIYRKETVGGIEVVNFKKVSADKGFEVIDFDRLRVRKEGKEMRLKPKEYPSLLFTDENGLLHRKVVEGGSYLIFIKGKYCYYLNASNRHVKKGPYGELFMSGLRPSGANASYVTYYWSLGIDGLVKEIKDTDFIKELEKYNLDKDFKSKNPKRDLVLKLDYYEKKHEVYVEFFNLLNQKQKM